MTNSGGEYALPNLAPGTCTVRESVAVTGETPVLDMTTASVGTLLEKETLWFGELTRRLPAGR